MKSILLFFFLAFPLIGFTQKRIIIKFCPASLVDDLSFPTIQSGVEINLSKRIGWYNELGIKYRKSSLRQKLDTSFLSSKGFKIKTEIRYYLKKEKILTGKCVNEIYLAANLFYTNDHHNTSINYYYQNDSSTITVDNFGAKKSVLGSNLLFGYQKAGGNHFVVDVYAGFGIRLLHIPTVNKEFNPDRDEFYVEGYQGEGIPGYLRRLDATGGNSVKFNLTLGVRLCYMF